MQAIHGAIARIVIGSIGSWLSFMVRTNNLVLFILSAIYGIAHSSYQLFAHLSEMKIIVVHDLVMASALMETSVMVRASH